MGVRLMVPCIAIGDGVALGLARGRPECVAAAVQGISSVAFVASDLGRLKPAQTAIISLGASDAPGADTTGSLRRLRQAVTAERVIWLVPNASPAVRLAITTVAAEWRDSLIDTRPALPAEAMAQVAPGASQAVPVPTPGLHVATGADPEAALMACGSSVDPSTLRAIMRVESGAQVYAINVNGAPYQPSLASTPADATAEAQAWIARGYSVDLGLMQVNSRNLQSLGFTVAQMFDPCTNIQAGASILTADYLSASAARTNPQDALKAALSAYNTGNFERGFYNGYVAKYYGPGAEIGYQPIVTAAAYRPHHAGRVLPPNPYTASPGVYSREAANE
ncbi:lytic transglycosylase domain-containing protein [Acidisoma cladoniae]|uniref:lytic transglycosylase domain-containing protein n=1 Tax=Acidisoma cladoniae TaxID=3040935 RepID=UPI0025502C99|nr:lytic transglycosylase domain-containing protein [Acidisoma sp. PAMC 29798]